MTLILAANLTDKLYLAADTRVSQNGTVLNDQQMKVALVNSHVLIGCAGSRDLARFVVSNLKKEFPSQNIRQVRSKIESILPGLIDNYITRFTPTITKLYLVLIFAGLNKSQKKRIEKGKLLEIIKKDQEASNKRLESKWPNLDIGSMSSADLQHWSHDVVTSKANMKESLFQAVMGSGEVDAPDSHVFTAEFRGNLYLLRGEELNVFKYNDYGWATYVARGTDFLTENNVPQTFLGDIEFRRGSGHTAQDLLPFAGWIHANFGNNINGAITLFEISDEYVGLVQGEIRRFNVKTGKDELVSEVFLQHGLYHMRDKSGLVLRLNQLDEILIKPDDSLGI